MKAEVPEVLQGSNLVSCRRLISASREYVVWPRGGSWKSVRVREKLLASGKDAGLPAGVRKASLGQRASGKQAGAPWASGMQAGGHARQIINLEGRGASWKATRVWRAVAV